MDFSELSDQNLEDLRYQIEEYYRTYYSEIRSRLADHELAIPPQAVPEFLQGYRRIVTALGRDGIVITHWPAAQDSFEFYIYPDRMAKDLAAEECGGEPVIDYSPGSDFGSYEISEPLRLTVEDQVIWTAPWKRLDISSRVDAWQSLERARKAAEEDLAFYVKARPS